MTPEELRNEMIRNPGAARGTIGRRLHQSKLDAEEAAKVPGRSNTSRDEMIGIAEKLNGDARGSFAEMKRAQLGESK